MKKYLLKTLLISSVLFVLFVSFNSFSVKNNHITFSPFQTVSAQYDYTGGWDTTNTPCTDCNSYYYDASNYNTNYNWDTPNTNTNTTPCTTTDCNSYYYDASNYNTNYNWDNTPSVNYNTDSAYTDYNWNDSSYVNYNVNNPTTYTPSYYTQPTYVTPSYYQQPSYNYPVYQPIQQPVQQQSYQCWNGTYVYNLSQCPAQTQTCPNGQIIPINQSCPAQTQTCWNGSIIPINQTCPTQFQTCPDGTVILTNQVCPVNTHTCWNGTILPINQSCPAQTQTCPNGQIIPITQTCPSQYQTCWNGITLPLNQSCPSQYQTCWNGTVVPVSQSCPVKTTTTVVVQKVEIRTHSVITDLATKVGQTSAQCNGIGLISGNMPSVGWFEYGTSVSLANTTNSANIGSDEQSSFSNVITGLKPDTMYYCRAVMANADGTYKGKIISFMTLKNTVKKIVYAAPTKSTKVKTTTEFVCSDGSIATAKTVAVADTINAGGKLISIDIQRNNPDLVQGSIINYKITITNTSGSALTGVEEKIVLPTELSFVDATTTGGITVSDNIMTVPIGNMNASDTKTFILPAKISDTAEVGKAVVTTVYASYNLPVTGAQVVKDEVSSYMVANIVAKNGDNNTTNSSSTSSLASVLFPQTLLGWLVLFAIVLIIVVLIMNIHKWISDRKKEKEEHAIHHHIA